MQTLTARLLVLVALLAAPSLVQAQFTAYGIKVGAQTTSISGSYAESDKQFVGFSGYLFGDYSINSTQAIELNLGYSHRGYYLSRIQPNPQALQTGPATTHSTVDYVTFSSILRLAFSRTGVQPFIGLGPRVDILAGSKAGYFNYPNGTTMKDPSTSYLSEYVAGFTLKAGIAQISLFRAPVRLSVNYLWDLTESLETSTESSKANSLMLTVGVALGN